MNKLLKQEMKIRKLQEQISESNVLRCQWLKQRDNAFKNQLNRIIEKEAHLYEKSHPKQKKIINDFVNKIKFKIDKQ